MGVNYARYREKTGTGRPAQHSIFTKRGCFMDKSADPSAPEPGRGRKIFESGYYFQHTDEVVSRLRNRVAKCKQASRSS